MAWWSKKKDLERKIADLEAKIVNLEVPLNDSGLFQELFLGGKGYLSSMSADTAMRVSAVFACVRLISGAISTAPIKIYRETASGREPMTNHPYQRMLTLRPNEHITAANFWKTMAMQKVLTGNAYAPIVRARSGRPIALIPVRSSRVTPYQAWELGFDKKYDKDPNRLFYRVTWDNGTQTVIDQDDMIHVPNINWNGKAGMSTLSAAAQSMGLALSAEESAAKLFENGMVSQIAIKYPQKLSADAQDKLREHIAARHSGASNHHKPLILTEGGDVKAMSLTSNDAQLLQTRQFSVIDIARFFGVPPVMIGETEKTSSWGSGVEQMARWFVMFTLNDHLTDFEQEIEAKLFGNSDFIAEFDESELTRGDTKTRGDFYRIARGSLQEPGIMTVNEIRVAEGLPPVEGGDKIYVPQQQTTSGDTNAQK